MKCRALQAYFLLSQTSTYLFLPLPGKCIQHSSIIYNIFHKGLSSL
ncbi:hypothetical protein EL75_4695 [Escherichia coli]|nr:hypothetical protein EL75_4695 [Escherichia coli]